MDNLCYDASKTRKAYTGVLVIAWLRSIIIP